MSAANYYQPHIYIDGRRIAESAPTYDLAAVADFRISWGAKDWFSNVEPARLELTLLDPYGELIALAEQQRIEVRRDPDDAVVFLGSIDEVESNYGETTDPRTGERRVMWRHQIRAYDPLAALSRDRRRGPTYNDRDISPYRMHWGPCYMSERKADIDSRSPVAVAWESTLLDQYDGVTPILIYPVPAYERQQVVSLLTVLRNTARISNPLNRPYYMPHEGMIRFVRHADTTRGLSNIEAGNGYVLGAIEESARYVTLYGHDLRAPDGVTASTALREQVTRLELTMRATRPTSWVTTDTARYMENVEESVELNVIPRAGQQMTVQYETDHCAGFWYTSAEIRAGIAATEAILPIYGAAQLPPIRYRFAKTRIAPAWARPWLTPAPPLSDGKPIVYHLVESLTNWIPNAKPFAILGGTLSYTHRNGWEVEAHPSPVGVSTPVPAQSPMLGNITSSLPISAGYDNTTVADWQQLAIAK